MLNYLGLPAAASTHAADIDHMTVLVHWLMLVLFVGWGAFFVFALFRFRRGANPKADYAGAKGKIAKSTEIAVAIVEVILLIGYAIPGFLFAILLIILFAGGSFFNIFPLRGLTSDYWAQLSLPGKILDYFWHLVLPIFSMGLSAFATMTLLTKNSFLDEIRKQYVLTARAKGCAERQVLYGHVFRNAMLIVIAGFPGAFVHAFFAGSLLIETIFSLDGIGLLGFESVLNRDYAVVFATLYIMSLVGLVVNLLSDLTYTWVDPRIDFETREV